MSQALTYTRDPNTGRIVRRRASSGTVLLLDTSGSMTLCDAGNQRRIDVLATVLADVLQGVQLQAAATFDSIVEEIPLTGSINLPEPRGSTAMHDAMAWALQQPEQPKRIVVLSDGEPDDMAACADHAQTCKARGIVLDAYYCGPPHDLRAKEFMANMAASTGGQSGQFKLTGPESKNVSDALILRIGHSK